MSNDNRAPLIDLCGLWKKEGKKGPYLSGVIGGVYINVFQNTNKKNDKEPDYRVCLAQRPKQSEVKNHAPSGGGSAF